MKLSKRLAIGTAAGAAAAAAAGAVDGADADDCAAALPTFVFIAFCAIVTIQTGTVFMFASVSILNVKFRTLVLRKTAT